MIEMPEPECADLPSAADTVYIHMDTHTHTHVEMKVLDQSDWSVCVSFVSQSNYSLPSHGHAAVLKS